MKEKTKVVTIDSCSTICKFPKDIYKEAINSLESQFDWVKSVGFGEIICNANNLTNSQSSEAMGKVLSADVVLSCGSFAGEPNEFLSSIMQEGYRQRANGIIYIDFGQYLRTALSWINKEILAYVLEHNSFYTNENGQLERVTLRSILDNENYCAEISEVALSTAWNSPADEHWDAY